MDKLGESARKGFDFLRSRAQETVEVQKLSSVIRDLEERRERCLIDLGHRVMASIGTPDMKDETFQDRVEEVKKLSAELEKNLQEQEETRESLKQSVGDLMPKPPKSQFEGPSYDEL